MCTDRKDEEREVSESEDPKALFLEKTLRIAPRVEAFEPRLERVSVPGISP